LKLKIHLCQALERDLVPALFLERLADLVVLAIDAPEIAKAKEYIARAARPDQGRLFPEVRSIGGDYGKETRIARRHFVLQSIDITIARANPAFGEQIH
jgi:hypothetical protein